eukprot:3669217-Pyramimonas_sp.AAC.1
MDSDAWRRARPNARRARLSWAGAVSRRSWRRPTCDGFAGRGCLRRSRGCMSECVASPAASILTRPAPSAHLLQAILPASG